MPENSHKIWASFRGAGHDLGMGPWDFTDRYGICQGIFNLEEMGNFKGNTFVYSGEFLNILTDPATLYSSPLTKPEERKPTISSALMSPTIMMQKVPAEAFVDNTDGLSVVPHKRMRIHIYGATVGGYIYPKVMFVNLVTKGTGAITYEAQPVWKCDPGQEPNGPWPVQKTTSNGRPLEWADFENTAEIPPVVWHRYNSNNKLVEDIRCRTDVSQTAPPGHPEQGRGGVSHDFERRIQIKYSMDRRQWIRDGNNSFENPILGNGIIIPWPWDILPTYDPADIDGKIYFDFTINLKNSLGSYTFTNYVVSDMREMPAIDTYYTYSTTVDTVDKKSGKTISKDVTKQVSEKQIVVRKLQDPNDSECTSDPNDGLDGCRQGLVIQWPEPDSTLFRVNPRPNSTLPFLQMQAFIGDFYAPRDPVTATQTYAYLNVESPLQTGTIVVPAWAWHEYKQLIKTYRLDATNVGLLIMYRFRDFDFQNRGQSYTPETLISLIDPDGR